MMNKTNLIVRLTRDLEELDKQKIVFQNENNFIEAAILSSVINHIDSAIELLERKAKIYQPKGSMCIACKKVKEDCSKLDFKSMPAHMSSETETRVICTNFERGVMK